MDCSRLCWRLDLLLALQVSRNMRYNLKLLSFTRPYSEILNVRRQDLPRLFLMYATLVVRRIFASIYCRVCVCTLRLRSSFGRLTIFHFNLIVWRVQIKLLLSTHKILQILKMASYKLILVWQMKYWTCLLLYHKLNCLRFLIYCRSHLTEILSLIILIGARPVVMLTTLWSFLTSCFL
jgi:hypothetical protein